jgi:uncharacterized protein YceK
MKKNLKIVVNFFIVLVLGGCETTSVLSNIPKENPVPTVKKPIVSELIDGRYYCYPGCNGHKNKTSVCSNSALEKELTKRMMAFYIEDMPAINR